MDIIWTVLESLHFEATTFWCQVALFFVLHFSLKGLVYGPIMEKRNERDNAIATRLAEAENLRVEATSRRDEYQEKLRQARHESQVAVAEATRRAEEARASRLDEAREKARKVQDEAQAQVAEERAKALESFDQQVEEISLKIVSRLLSGPLSEGDQKKLMAKMRGAS